MIGPAGAEMARVLAEPRVVELNLLGLEAELTTTHRAIVLDQRGQEASIVGAYLGEETGLPEVFDAGVMSGGELGSAGASLIVMESGRTVYVEGGIVYVVGPEAEGRPFLDPNNYKIVGPEAEGRPFLDPNNYKIVGPEAEGPFEEISVASPFLDPDDYKIAVGGKLSFTKSMNVPELDNDTGYHEEDTVAEVVLIMPPGEWLDGARVEAGAETDGYEVTIKAISQTKDRIDVAMSSDEENAGLGLVEWRERELDIVFEALVETLVAGWAQKAHGKTKEVNLFDGVYEDTTKIQDLVRREAINRYVNLLVQVANQNQY